jgi:hypothetical protein
MSTNPSTTTEPTAILAGAAIIVSASFVPSAQSHDEQPEGVTLSPEGLAVKLAYNPQLPNITASEPESSGHFSDLNQQLNDFAAQLPTAAASGHVPAGEQNEQRCHDAKCAVMRYYGASTIAEYLQGRYTFSQITVLALLSAIRYPIGAVVMNVLQKTAGRLSRFRRTRSTPQT